MPVLGARSRACRVLCSCKDIRWRTMHMRSGAPWVERELHASRYRTLARWLADLEIQHGASSYFHDLMDLGLRVHAHDDLQALHKGHLFETEPWRVGSPARGWLTARTFDVSVHVQLQPAQGCVCECDSRNLSQVPRVCAWTAIASVHTASVSISCTTPCSDHMHRPALSVGL